MKTDSGLLTTDIALELINLIENQVLKPHYQYSEFRMFDNGQLLSLYRRELLAKVDRQYHYVRISDGANREAWALIADADYDSSVFGFRVGVVDTAIVSVGFSEGYGSIFSAITKHAIDNAYRYLSYSVNTNDASSQQLVNAAFLNGFYYINTLVTFGFTKDSFHELNLEYKYDPGIVVRFSNPDDFEPLFDLAGKAYKIDRYHLDPHLPKDKCDLMYAQSLRNSFFNGFVDGILVAEYHGKPIGYFSGKYRRVEEIGATAGTGVISSVSADHRGLGAFQAMNKALIVWLNSVSDFSEYGTYINNHPVHSVYIKSRMRMTRGAVQLALYVPGF